MKVMMLALALLLGINAEAQTAKPLQVCIAGSGALTAKTKCSKNETRATVDELGDSIEAKPAPLAVDDCIKRQNTFVATGQSAGAVECDPGYYIQTHSGIALNDGAFVDSFDLIFKGEDTFARGVIYIFDASAASTYTARISGVCCPG